MDCRECKEDLTAYMDGELAGQAAERMRSHLDRCPPCRGEYEGLRDSAAFVARHAPAVEPMPEIWNNLRSRIAEMPTPRSSPGLFGILAVDRWGGALVTLAATVVLAVGLAAYWQHRQAQQLELQAFMEEYIQMRAVQERYHAMLIQDTIYDAREIQARVPIGAENPFAPPPRPAPANPFAQEAR